MRKLLIVIMMLLPLLADAQADRRDVRAGNRKFRKGEFKESEIDYRKAVLKDSASVKAQYNLASSLYRQEDYEGAGKALESVGGQTADPDFHYNAGNVALKMEDYAKAVEEFRRSLLMNPSDLDAKENYIYAKKMLRNRQGGGGGQDDRQDQQDQNNQQDQQNQQDRQDPDENPQDRQDNPQDQDGQDPQDQSGQSESGISPQQAQQMLRAIQAKEKETQDKVNKEKAALLKSRQKEKNW